MMWVVMVADFFRRRVWARKPFPGEVSPAAPDAVVKIEEE